MQKTVATFPYSICFADFGLVFFAYMEQNINSYNTMLTQHNAKSTLNYGCGILSVDLIFLWDSLNKGTSD